jgi:cell wall-associated NlpC family hydrolase
MYTAKDAEALVSRLKAEGANKAEIIRQLAELCLGWPYVWASNGQMCTPEWRRNRLPYCPDKKYSDMIRGNCPVLSGSASSCAGCKWDGVRCFDCQGFVSWLFGCVGVPLYGSGATTQWNTASNWIARGEIASMPPGLVCAVYKRKDSKMSHAGMSMGDDAGGVIHCSTTVKRSNVNTDRPAWTHWGIPKGLYSAEELKAAGIEVREDDNMPTLRRGNKGEAVEELQALLNAKFGFDLEIDGDFGRATETAVKEFQKKNGLTADGVVGKKTWAALGVSPEIVNPPADNGNNEAPEQPPTICIPYADWLEIKAAISAAYHVIKKYEGVE